MYDTRLDPSVQAVVDALSDRLSSQLGSADLAFDEAVATARELVDLDPALSAESGDVRDEVVQAVVDDLFFLGPIEPLLADASVTEIMVNGPDDVRIERDGTIRQTDVRFRDDEHIIAVINRIALADDRHCDRGSSPMTNASLHRPGTVFDGSRVNLVVPPIAVDHPLIDIRKFRADVLTPDALMDAGEYDDRVGQILEALVRARMNVLIVGGTGSGKTTLLNAMSSYIPDDQRIITIEDTCELKLAKSHVVRMESRQRGTEGTGEVTIAQIVVNALRQRPDRIIVGECRGGEAFHMLQAMQTGHDGSLTTIHANNARHALTRLEQMVQMAPDASTMPPDAIMSIITDAVDIVVHVRRWPDGRRRVAEVVEVQGMQGSVPTTAPLVTYDEETGSWVPSGERLSREHRERFATNGVEIDEGWWRAW